MTGDRTDQVARAVLYEGYMLWPYRRSALKNQQRFSFGGVFPPAFARAGAERSEVGAEWLLEIGDDEADEAHLDVELRCLHLVARQPLVRRGGVLVEVDEVSVDGERHLAWEEATERSVPSGAMTVAELLEGRSAPLELPAGERVMRLNDEVVVRRSWQELSGQLTIAAALLEPRLLRLSVRLRNDSGWEGRERAPALARAFLSAHFIARANHARFVSLTDPPPALAAAADGCRNEGLWPVLGGEVGQRDTMLAAPIILPDHPSVAPESPGDLFDGGEIDALLIHSLRGLTEAEREEIRATDPRLRELLDRSLGLGPERMLCLYGAVREMRPVQEP